MIYYVNWKDKKNDKSSSEDDWEIPIIISANDFIFFYITHWYTYSITSKQFSLIWLIETWKRMHNVREMAQNSW